MECRDKFLSYNVQILSISEKTTHSKEKKYFKIKYLNRENMPRTHFTNLRFNNIIKSASKTHLNTYFPKDKKRHIKNIQH